MRTLLCFFFNFAPCPGLDWCLWFQYYFLCHRWETWQLLRGGWKPLSQSHFWTRQISNVYTLRWKTWKGGNKTHYLSENYHWKIRCCLHQKTEAIGPVWGGGVWRWGEQTPKKDFYYSNKHNSIWIYFGNTINILQISVSSYLFPTSAWWWRTCFHCSHVDLPKHSGDINTDWPSNCCRKTQWFVFVADIRSKNRAHCSCMNRDLGSRCHNRCGSDGDTRWGPFNFNRKLGHPRYLVLMFCKIVWAVLNSGGFISFPSTGGVDCYFSEGSGVSGLESAGVGFLLCVLVILLVPVWGALGQECTQFMNSKVHVVSCCRNSAVIFASHW